MHTFFKPLNILQSWQILVGSVSIHRNFLTKVAVNSASQNLKIKKSKFLQLTPFKETGSIQDDSCY